LIILVFEVSNPMCGPPAGIFTTLRHIGLPLITPPTASTWI